MMKNPPSQHCRATTFILCLLPVALLLSPLFTASPASATPTTLDASRPFSYTDSAGQSVTLPAITPASDPQQITDKFLSLIRYFNDSGVNGTIAIPSGIWHLTETLYLDHANRTRGGDLATNLQGAGQSATILAAAPGYGEIPLVMLGRRVQDVGLDANAFHHPRLSGFYDSSVPGAKYGLRTISTPEGIVLHDRGPWAAGSAYTPGDEASLDNPKSQYVCTTAHTSTDSNPSPDKPYSGSNWRAYWRQINVQATGYFQDSPLAAGPLDPATGNEQATYWHHTDQLTIDALVKNNATDNMNGVVCAVSNSDYGSSRQGSIWILDSRKEAGLYFSIVLPAPASGERETGQVIEAHISAPLGPGIHRISVQVSLRDPDRALAAWVDGIQQAITVNGKSAPSYQYPTGTRFLPYQSGGLILGTGGRGQPALVEQDWTIGGLKLSDTVRYAVNNIGDPQTTLAGARPTDAARYFSNDGSTIAYLPLDDAPPADTDWMNPRWMLVRVQHGGAATKPGATPQFGYGSWLQGPGEYQPGANVQDLTLSDKGGRYGAPFSTYLCYGVGMRNVTLEGGYSAFAHWPCGANNYLLTLRNVTMRDASNAGINNVGTAMYIADYLSIINCGRQAMYLPASAGDWKHLTLQASPHSDYLVNLPADQSQGELFSDLTILPEPTHQWPAKAVMTIGRQLYGITGPNQFILDGVHAKSLPPGIVFIDLPDVLHGWSWPSGVATIRDFDFSVAEGGKLAAFLRVDSPTWHGIVPGATQALSRSVNAWLDTTGAIPWHTGSGYTIDDVVSHGGRPYRCIRSHTDWPQATGTVLLHEPGVGKDWQKYWVPYVSTGFLVVHPDFKTLPTSGIWVQGGHILRVVNADGGFTEYRCIKGGDAGSPNPKQRPQWAAVSPATAP